MRILSFLILAGLLAVFQKTKSPHGPDLRITCQACHSTQGWKLDKRAYSFNHDTTHFPLSGQHSEVDCRSCHKSLVFSQARTACNECHNDVHQSTVGAECSRCHTTSSWLVANVTDIHRVSRFPLLGAHRTADCSVCHRSENPVRFDVVGVNCIDCHRSDFMATTSPNHIQAGYSEECSGCHNINSSQWQGAGFNHSFFPLTLGHSSLNCAACHTGGNYSSTTPECSSCHTEDYNSTQNPVHRTLNFSLACTECHNTNPGWKPAEYRRHDALSFPIYSGNHRGEWTQCTDCHNQPSNYSAFTCINCHEHSRANTDPEHVGENGYTYSATSCYTCHRNGNSD